MAWKIFQEEEVYIINHPNQIYRYPKNLPIIKKTKVNIEVEINGLDDLLKLIEDYPLKVEVEYNINMEAIHNIKEPLIEFKKYDRYE